MNNNKIQELIDQHEIIEVFNRYATGIDTRNRDLYRACFCDEVTVDLGGIGAINISADDWVKQAFELVEKYTGTQHIITNHSISLHNDEAWVTAYLQARHFEPDSIFTVGGYYTHRLVRTPDGWKIKNFKLTVTYTQTHKAESP